MDRDYAAFVVHNTPDPEVIGEMRFRIGAAVTGLAFHQEVRSVQFHESFG